MSKQMTEVESHSEQQARAQLESIREMIERLEHANECSEDREECSLKIELGSVSDSEFETYHDSEDARQAIEEDALSVEVRSGWYTPPAGKGDDAPAEFCILLCTGGPACRIRGELDENLEPSRAWLEHQDWGTPWTQYYEPGIQETLLEYARVFYYGE